MTIKIRHNHQPAIRHITSAGICTRRGFSLAELIIGIVILGVLTAPLMLFVARLPVWQHRIADQSRREAGRSLHEQELAAGIDPSLAPMALSTVNPAVPKMEPPRIERESRTAQPEAATTHSLRACIDIATAAEQRPGGAGWHLGAAAASDPIVPPQPPLPPVYLPKPTIVPSDGHRWTVAELGPSAQTGKPWVGLVSATTETDRLVRLELTTSQQATQGQTSTSIAVDAWALAQIVRGRSWTEYAGEEGKGDKVELLADGRRRWTTQKEGRSLVVEPSEPVPFSYYLSIGAPVLIHGITRLSNGASESIDYAAFLEIQSKTVAFRLGWPDTVRSIFGDRWSEALFGFNCTLLGKPGPLEGNLEGFFTFENATIWTDQALITAEATGPAGVVTETGNWTLLRTKQALGKPELVQTPGGDALGYSMGIFGFAAPPLYNGGPRVGRLSAHNDSIVSPGSELSILIIP